MEIGRLLFPALRWDAATGFDHEAETIETALELGAGGFILFGGEASEVRALTAELRRRAGRPLLIGADLERGAGQQFRGATPLPPLLALGALDDLETTRRAGELTAREARALGVGWVYGPVADLDIEPRNPIVGTRAFGADPDRVAPHVAAWIEGCRAGGALSCVKHFPGHGRTTADSHVELPRVDASRDVLDVDLTPFRAAIAAGVDAVMTAHVAYPALDPGGTAATLSAPILTGLLRGELGFDGLVVTDALIMEGVLEAGRGEASAAVAAVAAGCDALLYPTDLRMMAEALAGEVGRTIAPERVRRAVARIEAAAAAVEPAGYGSAAGQEGVARHEAASRTEGAVPQDAPAGPEAARGPGWGRDEDRAWALAVAVRAVRPLRGRPSLPSGEVELVVVDDDLGGPYPPPSRATFGEALRGGGVRLRGDGGGCDRVAVAVFADIRGWKGRPGLSATARESVTRAVEGRDGMVVLFGHPRLAAELPVGVPVLLAWGGEPLMQEAAALWLTGPGRSG